MDEGFVVVDDDFEVFDVFPHDRTSTLWSEERRPHLVYLLRREFDRQLLPGQESLAAAYAQLARDIGRCRFSFAARPTTAIPAALPCSLVRYCTQAVMAVPVELLHAHSCVVAECAPPRPLCVDATSTGVRATKTMRLLDAEGRWVSVAIDVQVDVANPIALIAFRLD